MTVSTPTSLSPQGEIIRRRGVYQDALSEALGSIPPGTPTETLLLPIMKEFGIPDVLTPPCLGISSHVDEEGNPLEVHIKPVGNLRDWVEGRI